MIDFDPDNVAETLNIGSIVHGDPDPAAVIVPCPVQSNNDDLSPAAEPVPAVPVTSRASSHLNSECV